MGFRARGVGSATRGSVDHCIERGLGYSESDENFFFGNSTERPPPVFQDDEFVYPIAELVIFARLGGPHRAVAGAVFTIIRTEHHVSFTDFSICGLLSGLTIFGS